MPVVADTNTAESPPATSNGNAKSLSTLENHTIPPFYACYLLRSKKNGTFTKMTYVGSTPDPPRRIRQHNGIITMGARKTRFFRPWEMEAIVYGFPSKLAALQFEWAWQNAETSRYLRRPAPPELIKEKPVSYFPIRANNRSPLSKITILQRLLVSMPWSRMTLSVQLFSLDAQEWWDTCPPTTLRPGSTINNPAPSSSSRVSKASLKAIAASIKEKQLLEAGYGEIEKPNLVDVKNFLRIEGVDGEREYRNQNLEAPKKGTCLPIPVEDEAWTEEHLAKWDRALASGPSLNCSICHEAVDTSDHTSFALCQGQDDCYALTHLSCLSKRFLSQEASTSTSPPPLLPDKGTCPSCESPLRWGDLIRGSYRRKEHAEDGGVTRKRNLARMARMAKLLANRDAFAGGDDEARSEEEIHVNEEGDAPVKKITRKGRPPKAVKSKEDLVEEKKTKTTRKAKSATDTAKKNAKTTKVKTKGKAAFSTSSKKPAMAYEDISDSGSDLSEVSERFDFDSEDDGLDLVSGNNNKEDEDDSRSSDFERQAAFHAAAEVSLEIQTNDLDVLDSVTSSPVSISPHAARTLESPTKRRRKMSDLSDDLADFLYQLRTTSTARVGTERTLATLTGTAGKETSKILAISDSD